MRCWGSGMHICLQVQQLRAPTPQHGCADARCQEAELAGLSGTEWVKGFHQCQLCHLKTKANTGLPGSLWLARTAVATVYRRWGQQGSARGQHLSPGGGSPWIRTDSVTSRGCCGAEECSLLILSSKREEKDMARALTTWAHLPCTCWTWVPCLPAPYLTLA